MAPLFVQKKKEEGSMVAKRALSHAERRREGTKLLGLSDEFNFDDLKAPWQRTTKARQDEEEQDEEMEEDEGVPMKSARFDNGELQSLGCPANANPAKQVIVDRTRFL